MKEKINGTTQKTTHFSPKKLVANSKNESPPLFLPIPALRLELLQDVKIMWLQMHVHLRAKEFTFRVFYPDGREEIPLKVKWDPYWQTVYYPTEPLVLPKGTRLYVDGIYDNSANNSFNPDPGAPVKFGDQYTDEMMFPTYGVVVPASIDPEKVPILKPSYRAGRDFTVVEKPAPASAAAR